jgi:hypothetical protein
MSITARRNIDSTPTIFRRKANHFCGVGVLKHFPGFSSARKQGQLFRRRTAQAYVAPIPRKCFEDILLRYQKVGRGVKDVL